MDYSAGQSLIDILLHFGFIEDTEKEYTSHYVLMKQKGEYNPYSIKRSFKKGRMWILFDYINIHISYNSPEFFFDEMTISLEELTSLIYFMQLSTSDRTYILNKLRGNKITDLYTYLDEIDLYHYHQSTLNKLKKCKKAIEIIKSQVVSYS